MATVAKRFYRGVPTSSLTTSYTVPAGALAMIKAVSVCNMTTTAATFRMVIAGWYIIFDHQIKGNDTITIPFLDQIINAGETIQFSCTPAGAVSVFISGKEVT
jgi:hypothetical protein